MKKVYTKSEIDCFFDIELKHFVKKIKQGELLTCLREIRRNGKDLVKIVDEENKVRYAKYRFKDIHLCTRYLVKDEYQDIILVNFEDFDQHKLTNKIRSKTIKYLSGKKLNSKIITEEGGVFVTVLNMFKMKNEKVVEFKTVVLRREIASNIEVVRMYKGDSFYSTSSNNKEEVKKIKLPNGKDTILLNDLKKFEIAQDKLQKLATGLATVISLLLIIATIGIMIAGTGGFIFIGIIFIPIAFFIAKLMVVPFYLLFYEISKRL